MDIEGARILVTGASSGIGAALAEQLAGRGARLGLVARRRERLEAVRERCGPGARAWPADLADLERAEEIVGEARAALGGLDAIVANAAVPCRVPIERLDGARVAEVMDVDFHAPVRMALAALPEMRERGSGQLVFVSSFGGRTPIPQEAAYNAAKYALCGFAEAACVDLWGTGVEVKLILPGPIETEIWDRPGNEPGLFEVEKVPAAECAAGILEAMETPGFEFYVPAVFPGGLDARQAVVRKSEDCDAYVRGLGEVARSLRG